MPTVPVHVPVFPASRPFTLLAAGLVVAASWGNVPAAEGRLVTALTPDGGVLWQTELVPGPDANGAAELRAEDWRPRFRPLDNILGDGGFAPPGVTTNRTTERSDAAPRPGIPDELKRVYS